MTREKLKIGEIVRSCGCMRFKLISIANTINSTKRGCRKLGQRTTTATYRSWQSMRTRCLNSKPLTEDMVQREYDEF